MDYGVAAVVPRERAVAMERIPLPAQLGVSEVLVRVERTVISAGTETANYTGLDAGVHVPGNWNSYPWTPGYGGVGRVVAVGDGVKQPAVGARVYGIFHHASHEVVDVSRELCVPVPDGMDATTAVMARMGNVAISAAQRSASQPADGVAIIGLGVVGNLAGQFFADRRQRVVGVDPAARRRDVALETGFAAAVAPGATPQETAEAVREALGARPRVVVDAVGDATVVQATVELVARNGEVILLGTPRAPVTGDLTGLLNRVHQMGLRVIGALEWNIPLLGDADVTTEQNARSILRMIERGRLSVGPLVSHVIRPSELRDAYEGLLSRRDEYLGVVIDWDQAV